MTAFFRLSLAGLIFALVSQLFAVQSQPAKGSQDKAARTASDAKKQAAQKPKKKASNSAQSPSGQGSSKKYLRDIYSLKCANGCTRSLKPADLISTLGDTGAFSLVPLGSTNVAIYSSNLDPAADAGKLAELKQSIDKVLNAQPISIEIRVPRVPAGSNLLNQVKSLDYAGITMNSVVPGSVRITKETGVSDETFTAFLNDLRHLFWSRESEAPEARVFYLDASDAADALNGNAPKSKPTPPADASNPSTAKKNDGTQLGGDKPTVKTDIGAKGNDQSPPAEQNSNKNTDKGNNSSGTNPNRTEKNVQGKEQSSGGKKTKAAAVGSSPKKDLASNDPASGGDNGSDSGDNKPPSSDQKPSATQNAAALPSIVPIATGDMLVFSGDDGEITEKKRILAAIDFPRPEVLLNVWSFQASSSEPSTPAQQALELRNKVGNFNDGLQHGIDRAYNYLQGEIAKGDFFEPTFYSYLSQQYVADSSNPASSTAHSSILLSPSSDVAILNNQHRANVCGRERYCLGYASLFKPMRPTLTDMLLAAISAADPRMEFMNALQQMMGNMPQVTAKWLKDNPQWSKDHPDNTCEDRDELILKIAEEKDTPLSQRQPFPLFCFGEELQSAIPANTGSVLPALRAALANFLFQYKMVVQYPHEFSPYDLSQSAQDLNSALNPFIQAFNRDLAAQLNTMQDMAKQSSKRNGWFGFSGHGTRFINNGIITVRTISGKETSVDTVTQNFFDATSAPSISDVLSSIGTAESNIPKVLKSNLTANEAAVIIGALNSVQPTTSKIGREFKITVTPHSLSGASAAQLDVSLDAHETAEPTLYSKDKNSSDQVSRVAQHTINTKVRLESIKLFEVSSFTAMLERSRKNFPLVPPFVEVPYIGSFISIPLPGAKEFHRSTAVMSAIIVPTAAALANGLAFVSDRIAVSITDGRDAPLCVDTGNNPVSCSFRKALSLTDFGDNSIKAFNRAMVKCFGEGKLPCNTTFATLSSEF
jgi:hypothetical protein